MAAAQEFPVKIKNWLDELIEPARLEAPDRKFSGHRDILTRSLARYHFITPYITGKVLEIGCGRGYGPQVYSDRGDFIVGVDISLDFLCEAGKILRDNYFVQADGIALPFKAIKYDTVIAFEVIEHVQDDREFLRSLRQMVRSGGVAAISTPNRLIASGSSDVPLDRFHSREYTAEEFHSILSDHFTSVSIYGQFDHPTSASTGDRLLDRVGVRWKYFLPASIQGRLSMLIRKPVLLEDCQFNQESLDAAHTFLAICKN